MEKYYPFTAIVLLIMCICTVLVNGIAVGESVGKAIDENNSYTYEASVDVMVQVENLYNHSFVA